MILIKLIADYIFGKNQGHLLYIKLSVSYEQDKQKTRSQTKAMTRTARVVENHEKNPPNLKRLIGQYSGALEIDKPIS